MKYFKVFGGKCYIQRDEDNLGKLDSRANEGIFLGYSTRRKEYQCYNKRLNKIVESANVKVDEDIFKESNKSIGYESDESTKKKGKRKSEREKKKRNLKKL